jgi:hypothetical protein
MGVPNTKSNDFGKNVRIIATDRDVARARVLVRAFEQHHMARKPKFTVISAASPSTYSAFLKYKLSKLLVLNSQHLADH